MNHNLVQAIPALSMLIFIPCFAVMMWLEIKHLDKWARWRPWFAWRPVLVGAKWAWRETVERKIEWWQDMQAEGSYHFIYRKRTST